jgi:hypothetical protein
MPIAIVDEIDLPSGSKGLRKSKSSTILSPLGTRAPLAFKFTGMAGRNARELHSIRAR